MYDTPPNVLAAATQIISMMYGHPRVSRIEIPAQGALVSATRSANAVHVNIHHYLERNDAS